MDKKPNFKCFYCGKILTDSEQSWWYENADKCCSFGESSNPESPCGCMGMPIDPPVCKSCRS